VTRRTWEKRNGYEVREPKNKRGWGGAGGMKNFCENHEAVLVVAFRRSPMQARWLALLGIYSIRKKGAVN